MSAAPWRERGVLIPCQGERLVGIVCAPGAATSAAPGAEPDAAPAAQRLGLVVIVGGPQYRAGSHRLFVRLCRHLAASNIPSLRFDVRGMGDSTGSPRSFEQLSDDIAAAITALVQAQPGIQRVVLWGLCDGASAALLYLHERADPRVAGLSLLNPWVRSAATLARTQVKHYYRDRLRQPEFWRKLLRGEVGLRALREFGASVKRMRGRAGPSPSALTQATQPFPHRMALGLQRFTGPVQLLLSEYDYTAREFEEHTRADATWRSALQRPTVQRVDLPGADHTLSTAASAQPMLAAVQAFAKRLQAMP